MTDNELMELLQYCGDENNTCQGCPFLKNNESRNFCQEKLHREALEVIQRQKQEIKSYKAGAERAEKEFRYWQQERKKLEAERR